MSVNKNVTVPDGIPTNATLPTDRTDTPKEPAPTRPVTQRIRQTQ